MIKDIQKLLSSFIIDIYRFFWMTDERARTLLKVCYHNNPFKTITTNIFSWIFILILNANIVIRNDNIDKNTEFYISFLISAYAIITIFYFVKLLVMYNYNPELRNSDGEI